MPFTTADLPALNACLNSASTVLVATGWYLIRRRRTVAHAWCMSSALVASTLFLVGYVVHKLNHGTTVFVGPPMVRFIYLTILLTHTILAMVIVPMVLTVVYRAIRSQFTAHARLGRWTMPVWLYVSVTGVVIYVMLYHLSDSVQNKQSGKPQTTVIIK